jgi:hypothetical protein
MHRLASDRFKALDKEDRRELPPADLVRDILRRFLDPHGPERIRQSLITHVAPLQFALEQALNLVGPARLGCHRVACVAGRVKEQR